MLNTDTAAASSNTFINQLFSILTEIIYTISFKLPLTYSRWAFWVHRRAEWCWKLNVL